jgi:hypothetical protein
MWLTSPIRKVAERRLKATVEVDGQRFFKGKVSCVLAANVGKILGGLVSSHPYDLEPVRPVVDFEVLLSQYKFVDGMDAVVGLDSRPDLLDMAPTEFERLVP